MANEEILTIAQLRMLHEQKKFKQEISRQPPANFRTNPPPVTIPRRFLLKSEKSAWVEVALFVAILADGIATEPWVAGQTRFDSPKYRFPECAYNSHGKITAFNGPFEWMGSYAIQVLYAPGVRANELSCYGRGTTDEDIANGNTTLGFHENCHQLDYLEYLETTRLPVLPELYPGMHVDEYQKEQQRFAHQYRVFHEGMEQFSEYRTDEVGYRQSHWKATGRCFEWFS
ncbi:hypothetical protein AB833_15345 [Chromatiales bacterium (ex Bugula neritina AB1)]|nr:hypothetical protein AB833_15345 [Chromatiales bacterium (ex Bugula neritina AB1)]